MVELVAAPTLRRIWLGRFGILGRALTAVFASIACLSAVISDPHRRDFRFGHRPLRHYHCHYPAREGQVRHWISPSGHQMATQTSVCCSKTLRASGAIRANPGPTQSCSRSPQAKTQDRLRHWGRRLRFTVLNPCMRRLVDLTAVLNCGWLFGGHSVQFVVSGFPIAFLKFQPLIAIHWTTATAGYVYHRSYYCVCRV